LADFYELVGVPRRNEHGVWICRVGGFQHRLCAFYDVYAAQAISLL
jgi:hypothetical protein